MSEAAELLTAQYLTFTLDGEQFALEIARVREVLEFTEVTRVPRTPEYMCGVINLRGAVVPVIDLRQRFGMGCAEQTVNTCVVITEVEADGESLVLGALVDAVQEVFDLDPDAIEPAPKIGTRLDTQYLLGMGKKDEEFVMLLDADRALGGDDAPQILQSTTS